MKKILDIFLNGIIYKNPLFVSLLGMCAALAVTTSAINALGMGLAVTVSIIFSNMLISLFRKLIPPQIRIAAYIVIIAGFVTCIEMVIKAFIPALDKSLGIFIPLIVVNCMLFARAEAFASKNSVLPSILDGLVMGLGYTFAMLLMGIIREVLGFGSIFGFKLFGTDTVVAFFIYPAGAFITLGILVAVMKAMIRKIEHIKKMKATDTRIFDRFDVKKKHFFGFGKGGDKS